MAFEKYNPFTNTFLFWDLKTLFQDLAKIKGSSLTLFEETCICGLLSGYPPTKIADKIPYNLNSLKVAMTRTIYGYISDLTDSKSVSWGSVTIVLEDYKHPELKVLEQHLLSLPFSQKTKNSSKVTDIIKTIEDAQKMQKELTDSDIQLVKKYVTEGQCLTIKDPDGAIKLFLKALEVHAFQVAAIENIIHCYDKLGQYYNSFVVCDLVLWMLRSDMELTMEALSTSEKYQIKQNCYTKIYRYLGSAMSELAEKNRNCLYTKIAYDFYDDALHHLPYDVITSSDIVDLFIMTTKNDSLNAEETQKYYGLAQKAMEVLLVVARNPKSNFEKYKTKVIEQATRYCTGLDPEWQEQLKNLESLN
jgi:hypothetical protein